MHLRKLAGGTNHWDQVAAPQVHTCRTNTYVSSQSLVACGKLPSVVRGSGIDAE